MGGSDPRFAHLHGGVASGVPEGRAAGPVARSLGGSRTPDPAACCAGPRPGLELTPSRTRSQNLRAAEYPPAGSQVPDAIPAVFFLRVLLEDTGEMFRVTNCRRDMTVRELKEELDLLLGIPFNLQRLQYLDQGILMDDTTLKFHDVVPGGVLSLCVWHYDGWTELVVAAVEGDPAKLCGLGVVEGSFFRTANSQHFDEGQWRRWMAQRAFVALYISSHRGHVEAVQYLLEKGANCLGKSPLGRTPLHVAAAMGQLDCITLLLSFGASTSIKDAKGETPLAVARRLNRKQSERRMFLFSWKSKTGGKDPAQLLTGPEFQKAKSGLGLKQRMGT
ncbi:PREDICTED: ankyrin repeat domain-containing protein 60 [Condylura cristata]|uniref:ankyrin repeat domain-containing protein 60 n=1 Tax=Condylura cristata TaxID=143302 RepID=UPI0003346AC3|nr:PREDICTED: ankyrin repeat domain-containing protein 60 [Condylura cristata]